MPIACRTDDRSVAGFVEAAKTLGIPLKIVCDTYADGRAAYEAKLMLVRPDRYVAWTADSVADEAIAIMSKAVGRA